MCFPNVDKDTKRTLIGVAAVAVVVVAVFVGINVASGVSPPYTVVVSQSMQHSPNNNMHSQLGVIDTGDMVLLRSKGGEDNMGIQSFVDGYKNGYSKFGSYGDVIIYERGSENPIIHRAILWLESNDDGTWSAPSLDGYPSDLWSCNNGGEIITDYNHLQGTLTLNNMGYNQDHSFSIYLGTLNNGPSGGFLTMGDHNIDGGFDQAIGISAGLVSYQRIESVAWVEVPWLGSLKMIFSGEKASLNNFVPNTIPSLAAAVLLFIFVLIGISFLFDYRYYWKYRKEMIEEMNALPPSFPVEKENNE